MENTKVQTTVEARRNFLKKVAYTAPAVMALGALVAPMSAHASNLGKASKAAKGNNGFGNGDQVSPGGSARRNGAENKVGSTTPPTTTTAPGRSGTSSAGGKKK